jgi:RNA polymerase sigma factor (TIGR02999 family)
MSKGLETFCSHPELLVLNGSDLICAKGAGKGPGLSLQCSELEDDAEPQEPPATVSQLLPNLRNADERALAELIPLVYRELRRLAESQLRREESGHTLQATALVHEAYVKLLGRRVSCESRAHFFAIASKAMRQVLVEYTRKRATLKRGGPMHKIQLKESLVFAAEGSDDLLASTEHYEN